jgi:queuosine precursor transporter
VLVIGLALVLRDFVQCHLGRDRTITAILVGAALSAIVAPPALVLASMASFLLSELADMGVYTPLRERHRLALAVLASGLVGAIVNSVVFVLLALGSVDFIEGPILGKLWASLAAFGLLVARPGGRSTPDFHIHGTPIAFTCVLCIRHPCVAPETYRSMLQT